MKSRSSVPSASEAAQQLTEKANPAANPRYSRRAWNRLAHNSIHPDAGSALVDALVEYLNDNVLDPDNKITKLDMLDSLASIGGQLVPDPEGSSSDEYFEELPPS